MEGIMSLSAVCCRLLMMLAMTLLVMTTVHTEGSPDPDEGDSASQYLDPRALDSAYMDSPGEEGDEDYSTVEKRFLPWYHFKTGGRQIDPAYLVKSQKRSGLKLVTFPCARKTDAICLNGGKGPRIMRKGKRGVAICMCMCPFGFHEPRCQKEWWNNL